MNEHHRSGGPNLGLLLLIPAAVILTKAAMHRRAMWDSALGGPWAEGHGHGDHLRFDGEAGPEGRGTFRLPPRIEWILDTWHTRAHQATEPTEPPAV